MFLVKCILSLILPITFLSQSSACIIEGPHSSFDLSPISGKTYLVPVDGGGKGDIKTTICALKTEQCFSQMLDFKHDGICLLFDGDYVSNLGNWTGTTPAPIATEENDTKGKYLSIIFNNNTTSLGKEFELKIRCGSGESKAYQSPSNSKTDFSMEIYDESLEMCGGASGLSGGWIFLIILLTVTVLYVVLGMVYAVKFQQKPLSISSLPGIIAFFAFFSLAKDGVKFVYSKITKKSSQSEGYSSYGTTDE